MSIRKYQAKDREALVELWQTVFPNDPPHNAPAKMIDAKLVVDDLILVFEQNEDIIGACMVGYDGHRGWLYAVAVHPKNRRSGIATQLVNSAKSALKDIGCIKVNLQIRADNYEVAAFYKSLGFNVEERLSMGAFIQ